MILHKLNYILIYDLMLSRKNILILFFYFNILLSKNKYIGSNINANKLLRIDNLIKKII